MFTHLVAGIAMAVAAPAGNHSSHGDERLADLIEAALSSNPSVLRAFAERQAALYRVPQATALPDPTLVGTQFARTLETRAGAQHRVLAFTQGIPGIGKRAARGQLAAKSAEVAAEAFRSVQAETVRQVKHAYFDLGFVDRALAISAQETALLEHFEEVARRRYAEGFGQQADVLRLQAQITRTLDDRHRLQRQRVDLETALNALRDTPADTPVSPIDLPRAPEVTLDQGRLSEIGRRTRPEVRAAVRRVEAGEKQVHIARIQHRPDFSIGVTWGNIRAYRSPAGSVPITGNGKDSYAVSVGLTLPVFRRKYDAGVKEAVEGLSAARHAYRSSAAETDSAVRSISYRIGTIRTQIELFDRTLVPQAEQALESAQAAYGNGTQGVTGLLDIQRVLLDVQMGLARLRADLLKAVADLERVIGSPIQTGAQS